MTDEQINAAIAEACGWTECRLVAKVVLSVLRDPVAYGVPPNGNYEIACLNYCFDLNAMHEAEKVLTDEQYMHFSDCLWDAEYEGQNQIKKWRWLSTTARQRAKAFLRTLGKWEQSGDTTEMVKEAQK